MHHQEREGNKMAVTSRLDGGVIEKRLAALNEYSHSISASSDALDNILSQIGWTRESLQEQQRLVPCPINSNHRVPESSLRSHVQRCEWARDGYTRQEQEEAESNQLNRFFYENSSTVIPVTLDQESQTEVLAKVPGASMKQIPRTMDRLDKEFTPAERLAMYERVIGKCKETNPASDSTKELDYDMESEHYRGDDGSKPKSKLEVLAEMRDYRRRRQSYRAKNVHITKRSRTDVMREIIDGHMQSLEESYKIQQERKNQQDGRHSRRMRSQSRDSMESSSTRESKGCHRRSNSRERCRASADRSRSNSKSRDGKSHRHSKHKHKHKHKRKHRSHHHGDGKK